MIVKPARWSFCGSEEALLQLGEAIGCNEGDKLFEELEGFAQGSNWCGFVFEFLVAYLGLQSVTVQLVECQQFEPR